MDPAKATSLGIGSDFGWLLVYNLLLIHAWGFAEQLVLNVPSWSISTEWAAYLVTAAIFATTARLRWRIALLGVVGLGCLSWLVVAGGEVLDGPTLYRLPRCLYGFAVGVMVYVVSRRFLPSGSRAAFTVQAVAVLGTCAILANLDRYPDLGLAFPLVSGLLLLGAVGDRSSPIFRLLTSRLPQLFGRLSYSLYMVHLPVLIIANFAIERAVGVDADGHAKLSSSVAALATLFVVAAITLLSIMTYRWIEVPWRERGRRIATALGQSPPPGPATTAVS